MPEIPPSLPTRDELVDALRAAGCVYAEDEAGLLVEAAADDERELTRMLGARTSGTPLEQVLGWAAFAGLRIRVAPGVFVPRLRTTLLAETASAHLAALAAQPGAEAPIALDLGCGSGAVAAALAAWHPRAEIHAADIDPRAVDCARLNLSSPAPGIRAVHLGDLFDALPSSLRGRIDVIAANAPYVPTDEIALMPREARDHEPRVALDGGDGGVAIHRRIAAGAGRWLADGGLIAIETSVRQAGLTTSILEDAGFAARTILSDEYDATVVTGSRRPTSG